MSEDATFKTIKGYRDSTDIILKVLKYLVSDSQTKTDIMIEARMSYTQLKLYLKFLIDKKLIVPDTNNMKARLKSSQSFKITPKGMEVIKKIEELQDLLN